VAQDERVIEARYRIVEGVSYGPDTPDQTLDLYIPDDAARQFATLIVFNWGSGDKLPLVRWFAGRGHPVVFANVRRRGPYPQPVRDAFCAVAWSHEKLAGYGLDARGLVALGHSGGAVLAAHLGTVDDPGLYLQGCAWPVPKSTWLRGVVTIAGLFDYRTEEDFAPAHNSFTPRYFGGSRAERPAVWAEASPIRWVDGSEPPFLIVHGAADVMVRPFHSARAAETMKRAGVDVEYVEVPAADHNTVLNDATFRIVERFLRRRLANGEINPTVPGGVSPVSHPGDP
jgi:acetyl esterase/lipase